MKLWPEGGLWRQSNFLKLWSAETVSQFGTQISQLALPLAAIDVLHASAFEVAALSTFEFLPFLLVSLPAGVWVDRLPRRPILIAGDLARAGLLASIPIAYFFAQIGLKETLIIAGVGCCLPFLPVLFSPVRSVREMPGPLKHELPDVILADAEAATVAPSHI